MQAKKEIMAKIREEKGMELLLECLLDCMLDIRDQLGALRDPGRIIKIQKVPKQPQQPKKAPEVIKHNTPQQRYPVATHVRLIKEKVKVKKGNNEQRLSFEKQSKPEVEQTQYKDKPEKAKAERKPLDKQVRTELRRKVRVRKKRILEKAGGKV